VLNISSRSRFSVMALVNPAELVLSEGAVVRIEGAHARGQVAVVVVEPLVTPPLADGLLVEAQRAEPLAGGPPVVLPPRVDLHHLPVRVHRLDDVLEAGVQAARED